LCDIHKQMFNSKTTGAISGAGTAHPSKSSE